jgi:hypothetical protein
MVSSGANKRITESPDTRSLAGRGRPPREDMIGPDKAASASLIPFVSENAFIRPLHIYLIGINFIRTKRY